MLSPLVGRERPLAILKCTVTQKMGPSGSGMLEPSARKNIPRRGILEGCVEITDLG
jgi:hypothetical protein